MKSGEQGTTRFHIGVVCVCVFESSLILSLIRACFHIRGFAV